MTVFQLSIIFFLVGLAEWYLDTWEKLVSVRLKLLSTLLYSTLNQTIDFFMYVFLFKVLVSFWDNWHSGVHDYSKLIPYILYTIGKIVGTGLATYLYAVNKKKKDHERALKHLEKARLKKKALKEAKLDPSAPDVQPSPDSHDNQDGEPMFDPMEVEEIREEIRERTIESATRSISAKIDKALNENKLKGEE